MSCLQADIKNQFAAGDETEIGEKGINLRCVFLHICIIPFILLMMRINITMVYVRMCVCACVRVRVCVCVCVYVCM